MTLPSAPKIAPRRQALSTAGAEADTSRPYDALHSAPGSTRSPRPTVGTRGVHVVDLALMYAELERAPGVSQADLARRYRKSAGYVSVLCRLGVALGRLLPEERDTLRVPHVTFKAAQTIVTRARGNAESIIRAAQLLAASTPRRRKRRRRPPSPAPPGAALWHEPLLGPDDGLDPVPSLPSLPRANRSASFVFVLDENLLRRQPLAELERFELHVQQMTAAVVARVREAAGATGHSLHPQLTGTPAATDVTAGPAERMVHAELSLRQLNERVSTLLRGHHEKLAQFLHDRDAARRRLSEP